VARVPGVRGSHRRRLGYVMDQALYGAETFFARATMESRTLQTLGSLRSPGSLHSHFFEKAPTPRCGKCPHAKIAPRKLRKSEHMSCCELAIPGSSAPFDDLIVPAKTLTSRGSRTRSHRWSINWRLDESFCLREQGDNNSDPMTSRCNSERLDAKAENLVEFAPISRHRTSRGQSLHQAFATVMLLVQIAPAHVVVVVEIYNHPAIVKSTCPARFLVAIRDASLIKHLRLCHFTIGGER
jgi:hypothetical protein